MLEKVKKAKEQRQDGVTRLCDGRKVLSSTCKTLTLMTLHLH